MSGRGRSRRYEVLPFSPARRQQTDWLELAHRGHSVHVLFEADVTEARRVIRDYRAATHRPLSLSAYATWCFGQALDRDRRVHGYRWGRRLIVFDDVDATVFVAGEGDDTDVPQPRIIRGINRRTAPEIQDALAGERGRIRRNRIERIWMAVPAGLRRLAWAVVLADPHRRKRLTGTVAVTSVGMYGRGSVWGIPLTTYTLCMTIGGVGRRPGIVQTTEGERIQPREFVSVTLTFDHDVVDGAPAMRFAGRLRENLERGRLTGEPDPQPRRSDRDQPPPVIRPRD